MKGLVGERERAPDRQTDRGAPELMKDLVKSTLVTATLSARPRVHESFSIPLVYASACAGMLAGRQAGCGGVVWWGGERERER